MLLIWNKHSQSMNWGMMGSTNSWNAFLMESMFNITIFIVIYLIIIRNIFSIFIKMVFMITKVLLIRLLYLQSTYQSYVAKFKHLSECRTFILFANSKTNCMLLTESCICFTTGHRLQVFRIMAWNSILSCYLS